MPSKTVLYNIRLFFCDRIKTKGCSNHEKTQYLFNRFGIGINFCRFPFDCPVGPNISLKQAVQQYISVPFNMTTPS